MATRNLALSDDALLAEYVPIDTFKGLLEQRVAVGPDLLALLVRDGQIAYAAPGGHFSIGGLWQSVKDAIGGPHAMRLLVADLKPFPLTVSGETVTRDNVPVVCEFTIELQVNPERPANVLGLMKDGGRVTKSSLAARLSPHLTERVLHAAARRVDAMDLRGNSGLQDKVQADAMTEVTRLAGDIGLLVRAVTAVWAANDEEKAAVLKRQQEREADTLDREHVLLRRDIQRGNESTVVKLTGDFDVEKVKATTEGDLRRLVLDEELKFIDAREAGVREQELKAIDHELEKNRRQRREALAAELDAAELAISRARAGGDQQAVQRDIEKDGLKFDVEKASLGGQRRDVEMGLAEREAQHEVNVRRIRRELDEINRETEALNRRSARENKAADEYSDLDIAKRGRGDQMDALGRMGEIEARNERLKMENEIYGADAAHKRDMDRREQERRARIEQIEALRNATPELALALTAGFSQDVAAILMEQARGKTAAGEERMALMERLVQQAQANGVATAAQAREMFGVGMQGTVGVAHGAGGGGGHHHAHEPEAKAAETVECPGCHRQVKATDRFCKKCGHALRH